MIAVSPTPNAAGARAAIHAIEHGLPDDLLPATVAELRELRGTAVGQAFGIETAHVSRDGRTTVVVLGGRAP
jgi:hypothetical protein